MPRGAVAGLALLLSAAGAPAGEGEWERAEREFLGAVRAENERLTARAAATLRAWAFPSATPDLAATLAAMALRSAAAYNNEMHVDRNPTPSPAEMDALYREVVRVAPTASAWAGYEIPPETAWVTAHHELHHHNSCHNCQGGDVGKRRPNGSLIVRNDRASGYFGLSVPVVVRHALRLGYTDVPRRDQYATRNEWTIAVCRWNVRNPQRQVSIYFSFVARALRDNGGNLYRLWNQYKRGDPALPSDYAWTQRSIWAKRFPWPRNGQLRRIGGIAPGARGGVGSRR